MQGSIQPSGFAIDPQGHLGVLDQAFGRVLIFDASGKLLSRWGKPGTSDGELNFPMGIAFDSQGSIYLTDPIINGRSKTANAVVEKFDASGKYLMSFGVKDPVEQSFVDGVAVDAQDNVYVVEVYGDKVDKFDSSGKFITEIGGAGKGDGQFTRPGGIALDSSGALYVADFGANRVSKFDRNGKFVAKITSCGDTTGAKFLPVELAFDASGNLYVTDSGSTGVCKYDPSGKFISRWGGAGMGDGQFGYGDPFSAGPSPWGIAVDKQGNVYVGDTINKHIVKFKPR